VIPGICDLFGCLPEGVFSGDIYGPARRNMNMDD
jgi:hypothetical protein